MVLHTIWIGPYEKPNYSYVDTWVHTNNNFKINIWNNSSNDIKNYIEEAIYLFGGLDSLENFAITYICDLVRLLILRDHGGIYLDHDIMLVKNIQPLLKDVDMVLTFQFDPECRVNNTVLPLGFKLKDLVNYGYTDIVYEEASTINNNFIATIPNHPIVITAIDKILNNHKKSPEEQLPQSDWTVGPRTLTASVKQFGVDTEYSNTINVNGVKIYHKDVLHPLRGSDKLKLGKEQFFKKVQELSKCETTYGIHICEHFGTSLFLNKKIIPFVEWYKTWNS